MDTYNSLIRGKLLCLVLLRSTASIGRMHHLNPSCLFSSEYGFMLSLYLTWTHVSMVCCISVAGGMIWILEEG